MISHLDIKSPRMNGRLLVTRSAGIERLVRLPFGAFRSDDDVTLSVDFDDDNKATRITAQASKDDVIEILPAYDEIDELKTKYGKLRLRIFEVVRDLDRYEALSVVSRSHYLQVPARGVVVACMLLDPRQQERIRSKSRRTDSWSPAWQEEPGRVIGCAVIDYLYHGSPKGRSAIIATVKQPHRNFNSMNRSEFVRALGLAWISRFAVDAPYRSIGIGTLLATHTRKVAGEKMYPRPRYLEVITTLPAKTASSLLQSHDQDFLTRAGFERNPSLRPSSRLTVRDDDGDGIKLVAAKKLYYHAPVLRK
jgi:GNAT superfamily N-acetyltransferase